MTLTTQQLAHTSPQNSDVQPTWTWGIYDKGLLGILHIYLTSGGLAVTLPSSYVLTKVWSRVTTNPPTAEGDMQGKLLVHISPRNNDVQ